MACPPSPVPERRLCALAIAVLGVHGEGEAQGLGDPVAITIFLLRTSFMLALGFGATSLGLVSRVEFLWQYAPFIPPFSALVAVWISGRTSDARPSRLIGLTWFVAEVRFVAR